MRSDRAPSLATWLLESLLPKTDRDAVLGDLIEEYAIRARSASPATVARWYWGQVSRSIPQVMWFAIRRGGLPSTLSVALAAYVAIGPVESAALAAIARLLGGRPHTLVGVMVGLATIAVVGYVATWVRPGAAQALAAIVLIAVVLLMATMSGSAPLWYGLTFLIVGPVAALAGGTLCLARRT